MAWLTVKPAGDFARGWPKGVTWQGGPPSAVVNTAVLGQIADQVLRMGPNGVSWVTLTSASEGEAVKPEPNPCSFCSDPTHSLANKHGWYICSAVVCTRAAEAQAERIYTGLFDSPETRAAALTWVKNRG